jgi:hypothetical protein
MSKSPLPSLLLAASFLVAPAAMAESLLVPGDNGTRATVTLTDQTPSSQSAGEQPMTAHDRLIPFAEPTSSFTLTGESDVEEFTFRLDAAQAGRDGTLMLAYQNAVSVLPDNGVMSIEVNGKPAGEYPIVSPFDFTRQAVPVSNKLLREGTNRVRVSVVQHHRVDCSLDATYELWTKLNPALSGFQTPSAAQSFATFDDLNSIGRMDDGATELRLVLPAHADADMLNAASGIVQALSLYLGRGDLRVTVADQPGEGPGVDLYAGVFGVDPANAGGEKIFADAPYGVTIRPAADPQRAAVVFRGASVEQLRQLLLGAVRGPMAASLKARREEARFGVVNVAAGQDFTLRDAGIRSTSFAGRLLRTRFNVAMPADFYAAEYGTFNLKLDAATAPGLDPSSQMLVRVNDKIVNSFPFRNTDGQSFNGKLIELPLRAFRPGVNKVEMLAEVPDAADKACSPAGRDDAKARYVLLDTTTFSVPPLARVTRLPDLSALSGNAYPYGAGKPFNIYLRGADSHSASAAMTILVKLAMASGAPVNGNFRPESAGVMTEGDALVISSNPTEAQDYSRKTSRLAASTFPVDGDAAALMTTDMGSTAGIAVDPHQDDGSNQLIQAFENANAHSDVQRSWSAQFKAILASASSQFRSWLQYDDSRPDQTSHANALVMIRQSERDHGSLLTEIRAGSGDDLSKGIRELTDSAVWSRLDGGAAFIDANSMALVDLPGQKQQFVEVTDQSFGNYRRIAAAWLSDNFQIYVVLVIALVGFFAAWLGKVVQRKGVRTAP